MENIESRLNTAEHLLRHVIYSLVPSVKLGTIRLKKQRMTMDLISPQKDLLQLDKEELQSKVQKLIDEAHPVKIYTCERKEVDFPIDNLPLSVEQVRVVEIEGVEKRACATSHVSNTLEIGKFTLYNVEKNNDTYRFYFKVE